MIRASLLALFAFALLASVAIAQTGTVVTSASFLEWDYSLTAPEIREFRVYLSRTPNVQTTGTPAAVVPYPNLQWPISAAIGQWYAVVTAVTTGNVSSGPSNEVPFFVLEGPKNLRVRQ